MSAERKFHALAGGNRERDLRTGFSIPFKLTLNGLFQFAVKPKWALNYLTHDKFSLPQLEPDPLDLVVVRRQEAALGAAALAVVWMVKAVMEYLHD